MNYYEVLGVSADATDQQIKEAYRREAMKWHPDRHEGTAAKGEADRRFKDLALAYRTLRDRSARADYDRELDQKLRQEYTARQQEQARQEKAQQEHAYAQSAEKQTRQDAPKADFANTGPQFEEETVSGDDANQMFFEQMLDLAFELAGRGFGEAHIAKALIALGCPVSMANAVAVIAAKRGRSNGNAAMERDAPAIENFDEASWDEAEPYYVAAVMGAAPQKPLSETLYNAVRAKRKDRHYFWMGLAFVVLVIGLLIGIVGKTKAGEVFGILLLIEVILLLLAILAGNLFLGPDQKRFFQEKKKRYYMNAFKALHMEKHGGSTVTCFNWAAAWFNVFWLGYRRQLWPAFLFLLVYSALSIVLITVESGAYFTWNTPASLVISGVIGFYGNRLYFNKVQSRIRVAINGATQKQALTNLYKRGGPNQLGWILPVLLTTVFSVPIYAIEKERETERNRIAQEARAAQVAAEQAASEARRLADEQQARAQAMAEYQRALKDIEARYPELNPDSQHYNEAAINWVYQRKAQYEQQGRSSAVALQQAVTDYAAALQQYQAGQSNSQGKNTPDLDPYLSELRRLTLTDRHLRVVADMGIKFPMFTGSLTNTTNNFRQQHGEQARLVEESQAWGITTKNGSKSGFIVFQNRSPKRLKGIVLEVQAEERSCGNKGNVYYMSLGFNTTVKPASVVGINFAVPPEIGSGYRCIDIVDLIYE